MPDLRNDPDGSERSGPSGHDPNSTAPPGKTGSPGENAPLGENAPSSGSFGSPPSADSSRSGSDPIQEAAGDVQDNDSVDTGDDGDDEDLSLSDEITTETFKKFGQTYRMSEDDAGYSPWERFEEMKKGEGREPNDLDKDILDALMMDGFYERKFEIGRSTFTIRTVGPKTRHNSVHALNEHLAEDNLTPAMRNMLIVAEQLSAFNGESTTQAAPNADFESKAAVQARIRFCQDLATPILDAVGARVNAFRDRVNDATNRSISNF